jgi:hypothetical protein
LPAAGENQNCRHNPVRSADNFEFSLSAELQESCSEERSDSPGLRICPIDSRESAPVSTGGQDGFHQVEMGVWRSTPVGYGHPPLVVALMGEQLGNRVRGASQQG